MTGGGLSVIISLAQLLSDQYTANIFQLKKILNIHYVSF